MPRSLYAALLRVTYVLPALHVLAAMHVLAALTWSNSLERPPDWECRSDEGASQSHAASRVNAICIDDLCELSAICESTVVGVR